MLTLFLIFAGCIAFTFLYTVLETKYKNRARKVRFSNPESFEQQCWDFILAINNQTDFTELIELRKQIEAFFEKRPFEPKEYLLKSKVYKQYYLKQNELLPRAGNGRMNAKIITL